jgi:hypothetical protein
MANDFGWRVEAPWDDVGLAASCSASQYISTYLNKFSTYLN